MSTFIVGRMNIHSCEWMEEYFAQVPSLIEAHGGKFIVRGGNSARLEGSDTLPDAVFILEFPSRKDALGFWNCEEFAPLIQLRQTGSDLEAMLVDGI